MFARLAFALITGVTLVASSVLHAAPRTPTSDAEVVERLPSRATDASARELAALRAAWQRKPTDPATAVALARRYVEETGARGDPRYIGYAQAALAPWWNLADAPADIRVQRAVIRQFEHGFDDALVDLHAAVAARPEHAEAWSWIAAIQMVRADYTAARRACTALAPLTTPLIGVACTAAVDAMTGRSATAATSLRTALSAPSEIDPAQRLWALTRLAEIEERRGERERAASSYRSALALGLDDVYLLAAYADFLLDQGRASEVLTLLQRQGRADVLLLRLAIAAKAVADPNAQRWSDELSARFAAAQARGDTSHRKEAARFALQVLGDPASALVLARENYAQQREVADARLLLEAALAARQAADAQPVLRWMATSGIESVQLQQLAAQLRALK